MKFVKIGITSKKRAKTNKLKWLERNLLLLKRKLLLRKSENTDAFMTKLT